MFITKLGSTVRCEHTGTEETDLHTLIKTPSDRPSAAKPRIGAFGFDALSHLLAVCRRLCGIGYTGESEAFVADDDRTYLLLSIPESSCYLTLDEYSFIAEYGTHENTDALRRFLLEHGKSICRPNAVEVLAKF